MTKFLGTYKGAVLYEMNSFNPSEGQKLGVKVIAKATHPRKENMGIDFKVEAAGKKEAIEKIKKSIDRYLDEHNLDQFVIDTL